MFLDFSNRFLSLCQAHDSQTNGSLNQKHYLNLFKLELVDKLYHLCIKIVALRTKEIPFGCSNESLWQLLLINLLVQLQGNILEPKPFFYLGSKLAHFRLILKFLFSVNWPLFPSKVS